MNKTIDALAFRRCSLIGIPKVGREAKYAKNHFQQNRYSVFESHVMRKESISTKILRIRGNGEVM